MQIKCTHTFLDGRDRFHQGDTVTVSPADAETGEQRAARFIANGWAHALGAEPAAPVAPGSVDLEVRSSNHAQGARHG